MNLLVIAGLVVTSFVLMSASIYMLITAQREHKQRSDSIQERLDNL